MILIRVLVAVVAACCLFADPQGRARVPLPADLTGTLDGVAYHIRVPANWNGTLLVFAHVPPLEQPSADVVPVTLDIATPTLEERLLSEGYALAGSAYSNNNKQAADDMFALTMYFKTHVGNPTRTIIWGAQFGGLIAMELIEQHPGVYDAAISASGGGAGAGATMDWALAFDLAYKAVYGWPDDVWGPVGDLIDNVSLFATVAYVQWPWVDPNGYPHWEFIRRVVQLPPEAFWEFDALTGNPFFGLNLWKAIEARARLEAEAGGRVAQNAGWRYTLSQTDKQELAAMGIDADALLASMNSQTNITAVPRARQYLKNWADPTGNLHRPVLALHNIYDGLVPVSNERVYAAKVASKGASNLLVQAYTPVSGCGAFTTGPVPRCCSGDEIVAGYRRATGCRGIAARTRLRSDIRASEMAVLPDGDVREEVTECGSRTESRSCRLC